MTPTLYRRLGQPSADPADLGAALARLGDLHRERGELDLASDAYDAARMHGPNASASAGRGIVALMRGEPGAEAHFEAALALLEAAGDAAGAATVEGNLSAAALNAGHDVLAIRWAQAAHARLAAAGLPGDPLIGCNLARALARQGALGEARDTLTSARAAARVQGREAAEGLAWHTEAELLAEAGDDEAAIQAWEAALPLLVGLLDRGRALLGLAGARHRRGDLVAATAALEAALPAVRVGWSPEDLANTLVNLGGLHYQSRDPIRAAACLDEAAATWPARLVGTPSERRLRQNRGMALVATGRVEEASADLAAAAVLARAHEGPDALIPVLGAQVDLLRFRGELDAAVAAQREVLALQRAHGVRVSESGMMYTPVEDRSLNISTAALRRRRGQRSGPVLLIVPPAHGATGPLFPRGAVSVASFLQHHGIPAAVLPLAHVAEPHLSPDEVARRTQQAIRDALDSLAPRAVGISVTFSYLYPQGQAIAAAVRALDPDVPLLMGGPHVSYQDEESLRETPALDIIVRGEGEWTALELIRALGSGADLADVAGITWRAPDGTIHKNPKRPLGSVLELPPEDFGLLPARFNQIMDITALTSRGCAYRCRFCHEFRYWGGVVREHPVARVVAEMERLARYDNVLQGIDDSMLDMRTPFFHELIAAIGKSPHLSPNFGLLTRLDTITDEGAAAMRAAGMRWVCVGVESGSQRVLDAMNKEIKVEQIQSGLRLAREAGISASGFLIIGHPGDNPVESEVSRDFVDGLFREDLLHWLDLSTFSPYPGTPFYNTPERYGIEILTRDWSLWRRTNRPVAQLKDYVAEEIYLNLLAMLAVQDRHVRGRAAPPALGSGGGVVG